MKMIQMIQSLIYPIKNIFIFLNLTKLFLKLFANQSFVGIPSSCEKILDTTCFLFLGEDLSIRWVRGKVKKTNEKGRKRGMRRGWNVIGGGGTWQAWLSMKKKLFFFLSRPRRCAVSSPTEETNQTKRNNMKSSASSRICVSNLWEAQVVNNISFLFIPCGQQPF